MGGWGFRTIGGKEDGGDGEERKSMKPENERWEVRMARGMLKDYIKGGL